MKRIAVLAYDGCWGMGVFSATDFFRIVAMLEQHLGVAAGYAVTVLSCDGAPVRVASGQQIITDGALDAGPYDWVMLPPLEGGRLNDSPAPALLQWIAKRYAEGSQLLAMTTAAALLAAAGVAEGAHMASHWAFVQRLNKRFPACQFVAHPSYLRAGNLWTTGALNGSFDALLGLLAEDHGDAFAQLCAAHLLVSDPSRAAPMLPGLRNHTDAAILAVQDWIEQHHAEPLDLKAMARVGSLSLRTFKRRFQAATQLSALVYVQRVRLEKAKRLLLTTDESIKAIAWKVGYENVSFFVRLFRTHMGETPGRWRERAVKSSTPARSSI